MTKNKFFEILQYEISGLPIDEQKNAIDFYKEYFNECDTDEIAISRLDHPIIIAKNLYNELGIEYSTNSMNNNNNNNNSTNNNNNNNNSNNNTLNKILFICMALVLSPFILSFIIIIFSFFIIVPASFLLSFVLLFVLGLYALIPAFIFNFPTGLVFLGFIFLGAGLTVVSLNFTIAGYKSLKDICKKLTSFIDLALK